MSWRKLNTFPVVEEKAEGDPPPGEGDPPKDPPEGDPPPTPGLSLEVLPEDLRGLPEAEIKFHLGQMVSAVRDSNTKVQNLEGQIRDLQVPAAPKEPDAPVKPLEELILDDPEAAILSVLERTGLADRFTRVEDQAGESAFSVVESKIPGFEEHEEDVRQILTDSKAPRTKENILGALEMTIGRKALEKEARDRRAAVSTIIPVEDPPDPKGKVPEVFGLEKEIQEASGMDLAEWHRNKNADPVIKVPTS